MRLNSYIRPGLWILLAVISCPAEAQERRRAEVEALPVWAGEDAAAATRPRQYVFRDVNDEIVVSYPDPFTPGHTETFRFWLANRVDPQITASVTRNAEGGDIVFTYTYILRNGSSAATAIWNWSVVGSANQDATVSHPVWRGIKSRKPEAPQALLPSVAAGTLHDWIGTDTPIRPGAEARDFAIRSKFAPGLTTAYAAGQGAIIVSPTGLPEEVEKQFLPLETPPVWQKPTITIGPRFAPGTPLRAIIEAFRKDVADLVREGSLSVTSPYIQELQQVLTSAGGDATTRVLLRNVAPGTQLEKDLDAALKMSISSPQ
jgi:hypothetical protein